MKLKVLLQQYLRKGQTAGLIGYGKFGKLLRQELLAMDCSVLLCDPPLALEQSEEDAEDVRAMWGNGMGECLTRKEEYLTFLPEKEIFRYADLVMIQVPRGDSAVGMITPEKLSCRKEGSFILNFSGPEIFAPGTSMENILFVSEQIE